jgi:hypothetical protein
VKEIKEPRSLFCLLFFSFFFIPEKKREKEKRKERKEKQSHVTLCLRPMIGYLVFSKYLVCNPTTSSFILLLSAVPDGRNG